MGKYYGKRWQHGRLKPWSPKHRQNSQKGQTGKPNIVVTYIPKKKPFPTPFEMHELFQTENFQELNGLISGIDASLTLGKLDEKVKTCLECYKKGMSSRFPWGDRKKIVVYNQNGVRYLSLYIYGEHRIFFITHMHCGIVYLSCDPGKRLRTPPYGPKYDYDSLKKWRDNLSCLTPFKIDKNHLFV